MRSGTQACFSGLPKLYHSKFWAGLFPSMSPTCEVSVHSHRSPSISSLSYPFLTRACWQASLPRPATSAYHILNDLILPVLPLHLQQMVTEVKQVKAPLLAQQDDDGAAGPVQAVTEALPGVGMETVRRGGEMLSQSQRSSCPKETTVSLEGKRNPQKHNQTHSVSLPALLCVSVLTHICGGQRLRLGVILNCSLSCFLSLCP